MNPFKLKSQLAMLLTREREHLTRLEIQRRIASEERFFNELAKRVAIR